MICNVCGWRYAPMRVDKWSREDESGESPIVPINEEAKKEWEELFDSDFKAPCSGCSIR